MKEPFKFNFSDKLLKNAKFYDECPKDFEPKISYAEVSNMVTPHFHLLKQLFSGTNIYTALLASKIEKTVTLTNVIDECCLAFYYVMEGEISLPITGQSELLCIAQGKCFLLYVPKGSYVSDWLPGKSTVAYVVLNRRMVRKMFNDYPELQPIFTKLLDNNPDASFEHLYDISRPMYAQLRRMANFSQQKLLITESAILTLFAELLEMQLQQFGAKSYSSMGRMEIALRVFEYIRLNAFLGPLPKIEKIAEMHHIGHRTLLREFKFRFGYTLKDFINYEKMDAAHYILVHDNISIADLSLRLGYTNVQSFARIFKLYFDYPPAEARLHRDYKLSRFVKKS